jgi:integrase/recombinase XerD
MPSVRPTQNTSIEFSSTESTSHLAEISSKQTSVSIPINISEWARSSTTAAIHDLVSHFLLSCRSTHTRRAYTLDIGGFLEFANSIHAPIQTVHDITEKLVLLWQEHLREKHSIYQGSRKRVVQTSVARHLSSISSLLDFAVKRGILEKNCLKLITRPKIKRESKTNALTPPEIRQLLDAAFQSTNSISKVKNQHKYEAARLWHAVLYTLLSVGMRVDELCELRVGDFEETQQFSRLHMTAKGGETHSPIIHENTTKVIREYLNEFRPHAKENELLFARRTKNGLLKKLTQPAVYKTIQKYCALAGIEKHLSPHSCRATLATLLHNKGVPIGQIQELLNHKQITTTAIYIKKAQELEESAATKVDISKI